jgi:branched-chain amino acid transport system ATP-binding protein
MTGLLEVTGLNTSYGLSRVLYDVALEVGEGEVAVLLGRNGAGKTTSLKSIMGVIGFESGSISFRGQQIGGLPSDVICQSGLGYVPEDCRIFKGMSVRENLEVAALPRRRPGAHEWSEKEVFALFPVLEEMVARRADSLSGGQQRMLAIGRTLMGNPELLLLDEPSEGLAPLVVGEMLARLKQLKATGLAILLSEQNLRFSLELADRVYIIESGSIKFSGSVDEIRKNSELARQYLVV